MSITPLGSEECRAKQNVVPILTVWGMIDAVMRVEPVQYICIFLTLAY